MVIGAPPLNMESPLPPESALKRTILEQQVEEILASGKGVVICGDVGSGRSELARSVSEAHDQVYWFDLEANPHLSPQAALELFLRKVSVLRTPNSESSSNQIDTLKGSLLIIDNVDAAILQPDFEARIRGLAAPGKNGPSIILISLHTLPRSVSPLFENVEVKRFDDKEIHKLMRLYGAPKKAFREGLLNLVLGVTHGMPDLVALLLKDFQSKNWILDDAAWGEVLRSKYAKDRRAETQRRILAMQETESRELLYRLTLLNRVFDEKEVVAIAAIEPAINRARERLYSLSGIWLHRVSDDRWRTSPLLGDAGEGNLIQQTKVSVHSTVVGWVFAKGTLNQSDVSEAITHLLQADRYNDAGVTYIRALHALLEAELDAYPGILLSFWKGLPLPKEMDLGLRIFIRGLQVANGLRRDEHYLPALEDLTRLISESHDARDQVSTYAACALVAMHLVAKDTVRALPFITIAAQGERQVPTEARGYLNKHTTTEIFWVAAMKAESTGEVLAWMEEVGKLEYEERRLLMDAEFAADSASIMFDSLWRSEQEKPDDQRDWPRVLDCLKKCESIASSWDTLLVSACILRSQLSVRIVHSGDSESSQADAERFYAANEGHDLARFIVSDGAAGWFIDADRWDLASIWLTRAYQYDGPKLPLHRQLNSLRYGHLLLREGAPSIVPFDRAIAIGESSDHLTLFNQLKARAEMATFLWKTGQTNELYAAWCDVVRGVIEHREENMPWKHFFMLAANNTAFYCSDRARSKASEGLVTEPRAGMFIGGIQSLASRYRPGIVFLMPGGMAQWADELGKEREAAEWANLAQQMGQEVSKNGSAGMYQMHAIPLDIKEHRYADALLHANETAIGFLNEKPLDISDDRRRQVAPDRLNEVRAPRDSLARFVRLNLGILPSLLEISVDAERNPAEVRSLLHALLADAQTKRDDDPEVWDVGIKVLKDILAGKLRWNEIRNTSHTEMDEEEKARALLLAFGLWITPTDTPSDLLLAQATRTPFLAAYFPHMGGIGRTVCISIGKMWAAKIERSPFCYRRPAQTISRISQLAAQAKLGELIITLADSIGVGLKDETRELFKNYVLRK
jgi:hypothetical protein